MRPRSSKNKSGFSGCSVLSFESRKAAEMENLIRKHGGNPRVVPSMREIPFEVNQEAIEFAKKVMEGGVDVVLLTTGVGTRFLFEGIEKYFSNGKFRDRFSQITVIARGPKPSKVLKSMGLAPTYTAQEPHTWREILDLCDREVSIKDKKVFLQEYGAENEGFIRELKKRGAHVSRIPVYRWALPEDCGPLRKTVMEISDGKAEILLFTNETQIHHVLRVASEEGLEQSLLESLRRMVVASLGPIVSENLRKVGIQCDFESSRPVMEPFVKEASVKCRSLVLEKKEAVREETGRIQLKNYEIKPYSSKGCVDSAFMKACRFEPTGFTPIWIMRQAGRYMKEYRDIRSKVGFLELCKNSDLACEVTVTAQERLGVDAAIIFSDILLITEPMGVGLEYTKGGGPLIHRPVRTVSDVRNLKQNDPQESLSFVMEAIRKTRSALKPDIPLIGFAGAPFTVVSYMIEGKGSHQYLNTKLLMYREPSAWEALMNQVTDRTILYINSQIEAGAQAVQIFDSWVGCLSPHDYKTFVFPYMKRLFSSLISTAPAIHFGTGTSSLLELMRDAGGTVIGLDWRVEFGETRSRLGRIPVQGNLDPLVLLSDQKTIRDRVQLLIEQNENRPGHIFNLGHGVLPQTPVENVAALVEMVHTFSRT